LKGSIEAPNSNVTFSDDDDAFLECQSSLGDLSGRNSINTTITKDSDDQNVTINDFDQQKSGNDTLTLADVENAVEAAEVAVEAGKLNETETLGVDDQTFDAGNPQEIETASEFPTKVNPFEDYGEPMETSMMDDLKYGEELSKTFEAPQNEPEMAKSSPPRASPSDVSSPVIPKVEFLPEIPAVEEFAPVPSPQKIQHESPQKVESPRATTPELASTQLPQTPETEAEEPVYHNIDERSFNKSLSNANQTFDAEPPTKEPSLTEQKSLPSPVKEHQKSPESFKKSENFFEQMESRFDVEFKMPAAPVFKPQQQPTIEEQFSTCGTSCKKISINRKKLRVCDSLTK
jgi:hypothetical protein